MWARSLLFVGFCLFSLAALAAYLAPNDQPIEPARFDPQRDRQEDFRQVVDTVNDQYREAWSAADLVPAGRASDLAICRRLSLGLTGTVPSLEEIRQIEAQPAEHRVAWWVARLLEDRRYCDYVAERLARAYVGVEEGPFLVYRRRRFVTWLADQLQENVRYDQLARQLISDSGLWTDSPAVNFITVTLDQNNDSQPDEIRLARRVSRALLGVRLDCVQCHDDHLNGEWLQSDFHGLAAFFAEARQSITGVRDEQRQYEYQYLHADEPEIVPPRVPFAGELLEPVGTRRQQLAGWITHKENRAFARTAVGRVWALLFGVSLFDGIDNIPLEGPYPPGLEVLVDDFVQHGYDLQRLVRVIAATDVFQRDSRADHELTAQHEQHFAAFPLSRLRPEQISGSLLQAASLKTIDAQSHILVRIGRSLQQGDFVQRYGDTGEDEFGAHGGTIPQRLLLMNGNLVKERTEDNLIGNASTRIAVLAPDDETAIDTAYLAVLSRRATAVEKSHFVGRLDDTRGDERKQRLEDIYWTLLNSAEFFWNH